MHADGHTGYPPIRRFPHLAPAMGSVPIFGERGLRSAGDPATSPTEQALSTPSSTAATTPSVESDLLVGTATSGLSGAIVGWAAAGSGRGAAIGAGVSIGLWSGFTVTGHWSELSLRARGILLGGVGIGLFGAALLSYTRKE